jgi:hypothetical protein
MEHYLMTFSMSSLDMLVALIFASPLFLAAAYGLMKLSQRWESERQVEEPKEMVDQLPMYSSISLDHSNDDGLQAIVIPYTSESQEITIPPPAYTDRGLEEL